MKESIQVHHSTHLESQPLLLYSYREVTARVFSYSQAFSNREWYTRWGVHYIPSIMRAHQLQQCNNFKVSRTTLLLCVFYFSLLKFPLFDSKHWLEFYSRVGPGSPVVRREGV